MNYSLHNKMLATKLLSFVDLDFFDVVPLSSSNADLLTEFEKKSFYKECFNVNYINLNKFSKLCQFTYIAIKNDKCVGVIQASYPYVINGTYYEKEVQKNMKTSQNIIVIFNLCVMKEYRHKNIAQNLVQKVVEEIKNKQCIPYLTVSKVETMNNSSKLLKYYTKLGFTLLKEDPSFFHMYYR